MNGSYWKGKMEGVKTMTENSRLNALEVALNNEMRERAFYLKHVQRTKTPLVKLCSSRLEMMNWNTMNV